jgi:hypothetical protein
MKRHLIRAAIAVRNLAILLVLAASALVASAPDAGAHGDDNAVYGETVNGTGTFVVAYGRFRTERVHRIHVVRVCLQRREGRRRWRTLDCARERSFKRRDDTVAVTADCNRTRVYRARVFGHVVTRNDKIRHRRRGTTAAEAIVCD